MPVFSGACLDTSQQHLWRSGADAAPEENETCFHGVKLVVFEDFFSLPFVETVGVGENSRQVCLTTYEELKMFLLSEEYTCMQIPK